MSKNGVLPPEWGWFGPQPGGERHDEKTLSRFVAKFTNLIVADLSCFDRVVFKPIRAQLDRQKTARLTGGLPYP